MRIPATFLWRTLIVAGLGLIGLASYGNAGAAPGTPDTLVTGHIPAGQTGKHVAVSVRGVTCPIVAGGTVNASGAYQVVVTSCGPGTGTLVVDGSTTAISFQVRPGVWINTDKASSRIGTTANAIPPSATQVAKPTASRPGTPAKQPPRPTPIPARTSR